MRPRTISHFVVSFGVYGMLAWLSACSGADDGAPETDGGIAFSDTAGGVDTLSPQTDGKPSDDAPSSDVATSTDAPGADTTGGSDTGPTPDTGPTSLANPAPGSKLFVGANFWNIDWEGQDDFFTKGVDFATTTNPWQPALLTDLAPYKVLRFMDWNLTNEKDNPQAVWSTRKLKTQAQNEPVAFEWQIDLCNRTKKDYWVNVPHAMSEADITQLATLVQKLLDPSLRVYVEYSNEVWNGGFPQHGYAAGKASSLGLAGSDPAGAYYVYASVRAYEAFESVFGKGSPRLVKVLAGQAAWTGPCDAHMKALADTKINPKGTKPDFYAIAPYFSGASISALKSASTTAAGWTTSSAKCATGGGLPLISYEGGADSYSAGAGCTTLQHDTQMHDLYMSYLDAQAAAGMKGPYMQYTHSGSCWGLKEKTSDSLASSPKYKGVLDWLAAHP